jgi:molecular chaperone GrpE (heat shock protein)
LAAKSSAAKAGAGRAGRRAGIGGGPAAAIDRSSQDLAAAIDTLHSQMNAAMARLTELAAIQVNQNKVVIRTAPLDRATATFQRIVAEVVDDQLSEMLPPLVALRNELAQQARADAGGNSEFARRGCETLDHVLKIAGVQSYDARPGEAVDPVIHLAVGETSRGGLAAGVVAETVQCGFRTARGKVIVPAKVRVNRR